MTDVYMGGFETPAGSVAHPDDSEDASSRSVNHFCTGPDTSYTHLAVLCVSVNVMMRR